MKSWSIIAAAITLAGTTNSAPSPRFSFSIARASPGDQVVVHASGTRRETRLYLVARADAPKVHSRFDSRLSFVGTVSGPAVRFTLPPLDSGSYVLAYWCSGCLPRGKRIAVRLSPALRADAPAAAAACPVTKPNGYAPPRGP